jgi:hypothetical protein
MQAETIIELTDRVIKNNHWRDTTLGMHILQNVRHYYFTSMPYDPDVYKILNDCIDKCIWSIASGKY